MDDQIGFTKHSLKKTNWFLCTVCKYCKYRVSQNVPNRNQKKESGGGGRFKLFQILLILQIISNWKFCVVERDPLPTCCLPLLPTPLAPIWNNLKGAPAANTTCSILKQFKKEPVLLILISSTSTFLWHRVLTRHRVFPVFGESAASQSQEWREADE